MGEQHTPGPWRVIIDDDGNPLSGRPGVFASDELDCGIVHWDGFVQEYWRSARGDREIHANARLIAAAPDLLSELQALVTAVRFADPTKVFNGVECHEARVPVAFIQGAEAALAKARGES